MAALIVLIAVFGVFALAAIWRGYVLSITWNWFFPAFFGLPDLTVPVAIAMSMIVAFLTHQNTNNLAKKSVSEAIGGIFGVSFLYPLLFLGILWIVKQFI